MPGIPLYFGGHSTPTVIGVSFFFKVNTLLTHDTALVDIDGGTSGYFRVSWNTASYLIIEGAVQGAMGQIFPCGTSGFAIAPNNWYWVAAKMGSNGSNRDHQNIIGQVWSAAGGLTPGLIVGPDIAAPYGPNQPGCGLGWGVPLSSTLLNPFPNATGDEMTELCVETWFNKSVQDDPIRIPPVSPITAPTSPTTTGIVALYHCNDPVGSGQTVHDATPNGYDLSPGPNSDQILLDSPFG